MRKTDIKFVPLGTVIDIDNVVQTGKVHGFDRIDQLLRLVDSVAGVKA